MSTYDGQLRNASNHGEMKRVRDLLALGADPNASNKHGATALLLACQQGHADVSSLLLANGANSCAHGERQWTPLLAAVTRKHEAATRVLLSAESFSATALSEALSWAVITAQPDIVRLLLSSGADSVLALSDGRTPLDFARDSHRSSQRPGVFPIAQQLAAEILAILEHHGS
jgi:ankyrin repeat protein